MFLKSLELHGFKSFPDRTKLEFGDGITAVVGPNGSGKSNISDAVRWVLGEQSTKTLRGAKMEDVIFGGTQLRKPQGFAEVSITIDNSSGLLAVDSDTVTITRKYYRSTESEYLINGSQVRLKDINELLMDTGLGRDGYSMVGQGKIAEIVGAKSAERREIFEEAAGISKFRYRKEESERRLKMAEENLLRLMDILKELEDRLGPLKTQSEKARLYLDYANQKKELELSFWLEQLERLTQRLRDEDNKLTIANGECEEIDQAVNYLEEQIQEAYTFMQGCMTLSEQLRAEKQEVERENAQAASRIAVIENDILHHHETVERIENEIRSLKNSDDEIQKEIDLRRQSTVDKQNEVAQLEDRNREEQEKLNAASEQTNEFTKRADALRAKSGALALQKSESTLRLEIEEKRASELNDVLNNANQQMETFSRQSDEAEMRLKQAVQTKSENAESLQSLENSLAGYQIKLRSRAEKLNQAVALLNELELQLKEKQQRISLLTELERNMEGFSGSVKAVLRAKDSGQIRGIFGSVAQLVSVESRYSVAVEIALGGAMQNIVVENEATAKAAIRLLKEKKAGRATFLPLTSVKGNHLSNPSVSKEMGYVAVASELVSCDERFRSIAESLLGRIVIAEDIDSAVAIAQKYGYKFRIVTLDGQVVNAGGSITGGFIARSQGILSRKNDIDRLKKELEALVSKRDIALREKDGLAQENAKLNAEVQAIQSEIQSRSEDAIRLDAEINHLRMVSEQLKQQSETFVEQIEKQKQELLDIREASLVKQQELAQLEKDLTEIQGELSCLEGSNAEAAEQVNRIVDEISQRKVSIAELYKEIEGLNEFISDLELRRVNSAASSKQMEDQIAQVKQAVLELAEEKKNIEVQIGDRKKSLSDFDQRISEALKQREEHEGKTTRLRGEQKGYSERREQLIRESAHLEEQKLATQKEYDGIISQMWAEYELTPSQAAHFTKPADQFENLPQQLSAIRLKIKNLGSVNLSAVEEYKEVKQRHEYLTKQIEDVEESRKELGRLISELTENMKELFAESFEKINRNFSQIFSDLFGGGKGELVLTEPDNLLESGIEINVQPPGKVIRNLSALSGGEQAFVAIAIYFAILKVRPAPFCILDEIEAALDDVNVSKYAHYLRSYSDHTQFILITHRRGTMEEADVLYGVTMQQEGISKLLRLNVGEVEQRIGKLT